MYLCYFYLFHFPNFIFWVINCCFEKLQLFNLLFFSYRKCIWKAHKLSKSKRIKSKQTNYSLSKQYPSILDLIPFIQFLKILCIHSIKKFYNIFVLHFCFPKIPWYIDKSSCLHFWSTSLRDFFLINGIYFTGFHTVTLAFFLLELISLMC